MPRRYRLIGILLFVALSVTAITGCSKKPTSLIPTSPDVSLGRTVATGAVTANAVQRPLSDFLSTQGTTNGFLPPVPDFIGWANNPLTRFAGVDYAGLAADWLATNGGPTIGTGFKGSVLERPLADGRAEITVDLYTTHALTFVVSNPVDIASDPESFGYRATTLLADPTLIPALSNSHLLVTFTNTAPGAPIPDLIRAIMLGDPPPGFELRVLKFEATGEGPLHAAGGYEEGAPGRVTITQTGLFMTGGNGATADGFPVEKLELRVVKGGRF